MRKSLVAAGVAAAAAMFAWTATAGGPPGPAQDRLYGGGRIPAGTCTDGPSVFCTQFTREFSVLAASSPAAEGAYGTVTFGNVELGRTFLVARVDCLDVQGNSAVIGGIVTDDADPSLIGDRYYLFIRDTGSPGAAARDGVSANFFDAPDAPTCHDVGRDGFGAGYFPLVYGDAAVEDR